MRNANWDNAMELFSFSSFHKFPIARYGNVLNTIKSQSIEICFNVCRKQSSQQKSLWKWKSYCKCIRYTKIPSGLNFAGSVCLLHVYTCCAFVCIEIVWALEKAIKVFFRLCIFSLRWLLCLWIAQRKDQWWSGYRTFGYMCLSLLVCLFVFDFQFSAGFLFPR